MLEQSNNSHSRCPGLELCRFACALIVVIHHYRFVAPDPEAFTAGYNHLLRVFVVSALSDAYAYGHLSVQIFWVISGFIFFSNYGWRIYDREIGARTFFVWRFSRLYPLHFATLVLVALLQTAYTHEHGAAFTYRPDDFVHFLLQLGFASNWFTTDETFNGPIWSVSAEAVAYCVFFIVLRFCRPSALLCIVIVAATFPFHAPIPTCLEFFFAGGLLQIVIASLDSAGRRVAVVAAVLIIAEVVAVSAWWEPLNGGSALILAVAIVMFFSVLEDIAPLDQSIASTIGSMTYALYLVAFPLLLTAVLAANWMRLDRRAFNSFSMLGALLGLTILIGHAVHQKFETPAQDSIRRMYRRATSNMKS